MAACLWAVGSINATAADFVFDLEPDVGQAMAAVQVTVHQQDANTLRFTVDQTDPVYFGDLRGLFFHVNESIIDPADLTFSFVAAVENVTNNAIAPSINSTYGLNSITMAGSNNNNINPIPALDIGLEFGSQGLGGDDIKSITFDIFKAGGLDQMTFMPIHMEHFMAARVMSLWDGNSRDGSSKLTCCGTEVAEPSSSMGLLAFAIGGLLWRRRVSA